MANTIDGPSSRQLVATGALLDTWTAHDWSDGIRVDQLVPLDRVTVQTRHSTYDLIVVVPGTAEVMVRGGAFFPEFTRLRIWGSSLGGSFLKLRVIQPGFRMELADDTRVIVTSPVQTVRMTPGHAVGDAVM